MAKRKIQQVVNEAGSPIASKDFTSLVSKYSFSNAKLDEMDTKPISRPLTPPDTPKTKKLKTKGSKVSPGKSRNPGYAPPSAYSHLPTPDLDSLAEDLILMFIGLNPGDPSYS